MPERLRRHAEILRLVEQGVATDQASLVEALLAKGIRTTQATLSRDLRELGILKGASGYILPGGHAAAAADSADRFEPAFRREAVSVDHGVATLVIRTMPGHAGALAVVIDRSPPPDALGCIAGDDTIFLAMRTERAAADLAARLRTLLHSSRTELRHVSGARNV